MLMIKCLVTKCVVSLSLVFALCNFSERAAPTLHLTNCEEKNILFCD